MNKGFSLSLFLVVGFIPLSGVAFSQSETLRALPITAAGVPQAVTAMPADQAALERAGYTLESRGGELRAVDRWERTYTFRHSAGHSAVLVDNEYPSVTSLRRELTFEITFSVKEGRSAADVSEIVPALVAAMQKAVREDPAVVAGLGYMATAAGTDIGPEELQAAVVGYLQRYEQPSKPLEKVCPGCGPWLGFEDEYTGSADTDGSLNRGRPIWKIAGLRHYLDGTSAFRVQVTAKIPRRSS